MLALDLPLSGSRLIEASAGTGKTYTIAALYLRLVLGLDCPRPLMPTEILVVTFTDAATKELRDRIRARLSEAATLFRDGGNPDPLLAALMQRLPQSDWPGAARRLELAAQWMDEAAITTIHGWCQRMLREHAFSSRALFDETLLEHAARLKLTACRDYWRRFCYPLTSAALEWAATAWQTPDKLAQMLMPAELPEAGLTLADLIAEQLEERASALAALKAPWPIWLDELDALVQAGKQSGATGIRLDHWGSGLAKLRAWAGTPAQSGFELSKTVRDALSLEGWQKIWKRDRPEHAAIGQIDHVMAQLATLPDPSAAALAHASGWIAAEIERVKAEQRVLDFDDMLSRLDRALLASPRLASQIRQQFPVALIDEFQDTDALQYRIFNAVYDVERGEGETALLLIGDPKQAIYSFRGADIHTYLTARRATSGRHYPLDTNFRASHEMVMAVNHVFSLAEARNDGLHAFLFGEELPFEAAHAHGRREHWHVEDTRPAALQLAWAGVGTALGKGEHDRRYAEACAAEITRLLMLADQGRAGFERDGTLTPLRASDCAVLVRSRHEAAHIRHALAARGIASVYLSDQDSVYASDEAAELLRVLEAVHDPDHAGRLRGALASTLLDTPLAELDALNHDELALEERVMQFREYREQWRTRGVLVMLRHVLHDFAVAARLAERNERALTNLLHLSELLQHAGSRLDGELALIRHLRDAMASSAHSADDTILRLESDAALVRVVTIHKSKGLEYPLVFLPFASTRRREDGQRGVWLQQDGARRWIASPDEAQVKAADLERLREDLRLLYVALTRARHMTWVGLAEVDARSPHLPESALGQLLLRGGNDSAAALQDWLAHPAIALAEVSDDASRLPPRRTDPATLAARVMPPRNWRSWQLISYTTLSRGLAHDALLDAPPDEHSLHAFPRGAAAGTFLHALFEWAGEHGFAAALANADSRREQIVAQASRHDWADWSAVLDHTLARWLAQPLFDQGPSLADLGRRQYQVELEFWLEAHALNTGRLDTLVCAQTESALPRRPLQHSEAAGLFKGFADLVFEHDGRYWVLDYKSNWLGADDAAYTDAAMQHAMLAHRYDLQYTLYLLALHRLLRARLPDYDPERHLGGALYLFVRGIDAPSRGIHRATVPAGLIMALDALFAGKEHA
ncbi:exodeoxyribonuclease V subunit beta [Chitinibacteraceae bacterium HSL-7]